MARRSDGQTGLDYVGDTFFTYETYSKYLLACLLFTVKHK